MGPTPEEVAAGHAFYTRRTLAVYDLAILGYFSRFAWRCPARTILAHYDAHVSPNHLDIGVGTGYFLDRCHFGTDAPRLVLADLNPTCLEVASQRVRRYRPETQVTDVLEPLAFDGPGFDSVGLTYVLHCVPGTIREKAAVFAHVKVVTNPGATVFGATLLHDGVDRNLLARTVMRRNNAHGIFANVDDDRDGLEWALAEHLAEPTVDVVGCVALFSGRT